ncbi:MAG TPA: NAD(P)-dependent oxidoreductase [Solirubrobacteraceae bacterium]|jgi:D-3-phosphoglycerate dehydrogenase|nr:NAD(P)-dependent oxidoreductase [Solirubrobacteraceae bacterium]
MTGRVVLLDPAGALDAVAEGLGELPGIVLERGHELPAGPGVMSVLVPPEIPVGAAELARLPDVRLVAATATGFDHLDLEAIAAAKAWATHCAGYCDDEVADHAIALAVNLLRGVSALDGTARAGRWELEPVLPRRIAGSVLGVVGLGRIGRQVAQRGVTLGMRVRAHDPMLESSPVSGVELVSLEDLIAEVDVLTLHCVLTPQTRGMLDAAVLAAMPRGAYLVNCARAALVDHAALGEALNSGHLGGCGLDVLPVEPPGGDEPAFTWPRTIINPHAAYYSEHSARVPYRQAGEATAAVLSGREPRDVLARPVGAEPGPGL